MTQFKALKEGRTPDYSDFNEFKINAENVGYKLLKKSGWKEGQGLGKTNQGVTVPVNKLVLKNCATCAFFILILF